MKEHNLTQGNILKSLIVFAFPVLLSLFLQAMYGAVDLLVVGKFSGVADQSGVVTGSMLIHMITKVITGLSMGVTIIVGEAIGAKKPDKAGRGIGTGICIFAVIAVVITAVIAPCSGLLANLLHAPAEAVAETSAYIRICGIGTVFIIAYNVLGAIFRGLGDSKTPLITVAIACVVNILGDLLLCAVFDMGAAGAAIATVAAQAVSVALSLVIIIRRGLPFAFSKEYITLRGGYTEKILKVGAPIAFQDLLVSFSFLFIQVIVNGMGVTQSAAVGIAEKVCMFLMVVASSYMQSISAFVAQNNGAGQHDRAKKALFYGIATAFVAGLSLGIVAVFFGDSLASVFSNDALVITAAHQYLKAYSVDCVLTAVLFCFIGYFNGCERTFFVMIQGIIGAFFIRIPVVYLMSRLSGATLFHIGLGTPSSSFVQIILCLFAYRYYEKKKTSTSGTLS